MSLRDVSPDDFDATVYASAYSDVVNVCLDRFTCGRFMMWIPLETARQLRDQLNSAIALIEDRSRNEASVSAAVGDDGLET